MVFASVAVIMMNLDSGNGILGEQGLYNAAGCSSG